MEKTTIRAELPAQDPWPGRTLLGSYKVLQLIAEGGMGRVYAGRHCRTDGDLAIKVIRGELAAEPKVYQRFREEARIICSLYHPNVVGVIDFAEEDRTPFLVMERLHGEDLHQRLLRGPLELDELIEIVEQVGGALQAAHDRGVVHRDIKPQNVFLVSGPRVWAKVLDFGVAKARHTLSLGLTGERALLGTPHYLAPEALAGAAQVDGRADQWALGVLVYQALSGRLPFDGAALAAVMYQIAHLDPPPLRREGVPAAVGQVVARALAKQRERRFPRIGDFVDALVAAAARGRPARRGAPAWMAAAGLLLCGGGGFVLGQRGPAPAAAPVAAAPDPAMTCPPVKECPKEGALEREARRPEPARRPRPAREPWGL